MVYVTGLLAPERSRVLTERCAAVRAGLKTEQVSLSLAALMWRDLAECCLDGRAPENRSPEDRRALRETLAALASTSAEWRRRTFTEKLGEFLGEPLGVGGGGMAGAFGYKSGGGRRREPEARATLTRERWGQLSAVGEEYLREHRFGESMDLPISLPEGQNFLVTGPGRADGAAPASKIAAFDVLTVPGRVGDAPVRVRLGDGQDRLEVDLPAGVELAHADLLRLAYTQYRYRLLNSARRVLAERRWDQSRPLLLPALRELIGDAVPPDSKTESERIAALVAQLGDDNWSRREAASKALAEMGGIALRALRKAADSPDAEVAERALRLLEEWSPADRLDSDQVSRALAMFWMF
jgi:hypothetical protein